MFPPTCVTTCDKALAAAQSPDPLMLHARRPWLIGWLTTLALLLLAPPLAAAGSPLSADVEVLFPVPPAGRNGGVAAMGSAQMERIDAGERGAMVRLAGPKDPVMGAWWFPNHLPMSPEQAMIGDDRARLSLELESEAPVATTLSVRWRGPEESAGETVNSGPLQLRAGKPTRVDLPIPKPAPDAKLSGFIFTFDKGGAYRIRRMAVTRASSVLVHAIPAADPRQAGDTAIHGEAAAGVARVTLRFTPEKPEAKPLEKAVAVQGGKFSLTVTQQDLTPGFAYRVTAEPEGRAAEASPAQRLFVFPRLTGERAPRVAREGADLLRDGKRFGFVGVNYTRFGLGLSIQADYELLAHDVLQMKSWGVRVVRISTDIAITQPEPGVFPDSPRYAELLKKHNLDPRYMDQIDYFVALAGQEGIYTVIDWHGMPIDPYRYFQGGRPSDRGTGKPGEAIAYLAPSPTEAGEFEMENPAHLKTLLDAHRWIAGHFKGDPNLLGIEVPFNEPHTKYMAVENNWRRVTDLSAAAVAEGDPERLTFTLGPSYSHNNLLPSVTWLPPDRASGAAPHFYQANGPVPTRPDAKNFESPWLARELEGTFGWSFLGVMLPLSAVDYPIYNGESGLHGHDSLLAGYDKAEAASLLMEAQLVQEYATGMVGRLEWTLWGNEHDFDPHVETYKKQIGRFAPVYEAGPIDRMSAEVAFVQHPEAVPSANGHNFACIPFAKAALDLHLSPVHYLTDDQLRYLASAELSVGLEQVVESSQSLKYKAIITDRRHLDPRTVTVLKSLGAPVLWLDKAEDLTAAELASFLEGAGVAVDQRTPREIQLAEGPEHLVVYRRLDGGANPTRIYPQLRRTGNIELISESGATVFSGPADALAQQGIEVDLPLWRSAIFRITTP